MNKKTKNLIDEITELACDKLENGLDYIFKKDTFFKRDSSENHRVVGVRRNETDVLFIEERGIWFEKSLVSEATMTFESLSLFKKALETLVAENK